MSAPAAAPSPPAGRRILDPAERMSEVLFGLIMALTFTGTISAANAGGGEIRDILIAALGCNIAWGLVDAVMYLINTLTRRARALALTRYVRDAGERDAAHRTIREAMPEVLAPLIRPEEVEHLRRGVAGLKDLPAHARLVGADWLGAVGVFLLVAASTFPLVIPFLVMQDPQRALRTSHAVGLVLLFLVGHTLGRYAGLGRWRMGFSMIGVGIVLVGLTIALGG